MIVKIKDFLRGRLRMFVTPALFVLMVVVFSVIFTSLIDYFRVTEIELNGVKSLNSIEIVNNDILFILDTNKLESELKEKNPSVETVSVQKIYPNRVVISAVLIKPSVQLRVSDGWYLLSPSAKIIAKSRKPYSKVATISYFTKYPFEAYQVGDQIESSEIIYASYFINKLRTIKIRSYDSVAIDHLFVLLLKGGSQEIWLTTKKSKEQQFDVLRDILKQFVISGKKYKKIDLRFSKPIVTIKE